MVEVRMKTTMAGPDISVTAGNFVLLPADRAKALINAGYAEVVPDEPAPKVETATAEKREKAVLPQVKKRRKR